MKMNSVLKSPLGAFFIGNYRMYRKADNSVEKGRRNDREKYG